MDIKQDIEEIPDKFDIIKINSQLTNKDMNELTHELGAMLATIPTSNSGGDHGHIGMLLAETEYTTFMTGTNPLLSPRTPAYFQLPLVPRKWINFDNLQSTNNSSWSMRPIKDAYRQ